MAESDTAEKLNTDYAEAYSTDVMTGDRDKRMYLIKQKLGDQVDLRFYNEKNRSFHPKSYI